MMVASWPLFFALLLLRTASGDVTEGYAATGVDPQHIAQLDELVEATGALVGVLPAGHTARDDLRALILKLGSLRKVAPMTETDEWDSMLAALLNSDYYGVDDLAKLIGDVDADVRSNQPAAAIAKLIGSGSCDDTATNVPNSGVGRRLQEPQQHANTPSASTQRHQREAHQQPHQPRHVEMQEADATGHAYGEAADADGLHDHNVDEHSGSVFSDGLVAALRHHGVSGVLWAWRRAALDRPPPWERDCDCCFSYCPDEHNCLLQGDGLYLACRGESVGDVAERLWTEQPLATIASLVVVGLLGGLWSYQQMAKLSAHLRGARTGTARKQAERKDEDEEDEDEDEEDEDEDERRQDEVRPDASAGSPRTPAK